MTQRGFASLLVLAGLLGAKPVAAPDPQRALAQIAGEGLLSRRAYADLTALCDRFGARPAGSPALEGAIDWALGTMRAAGFANVRGEPVTVPVWERGAESAELLAPRRKGLPILGLGGTVPTPPGGVEAEIAVFDDVPALEALPDGALAGRIALLDTPFTTYGETVRSRSAGPSVAARKGAVALLIRSVSPISLSTPHTGALSYDEAAPRIPAAALTLEDATMLRRMALSGSSPRVRLQLASERPADRPSRNAVGEIRGREKPEEIVLIGGHIDSWDVGAGAQDDGAGTMMAIEAGRLLQSLPLKPRRTVRIVLFTNEEHGLSGAMAYAAAHATEPHQGAIEADTGSGAPVGFRVDLRDPAAPDEASTGRVAAAIEAMAPTGPSLRNGDYRNLSRG